MYREAITNEVGELIGFDFHYGDERDGGWDDDPYAGMDCPDEADEPDCPGHDTAAETSGDASYRRQADGTYRWVCDLGPCPSDN